MVRPRGEDRTLYKFVRPQRDNRGTSIAKEFKHIYAGSYIYDEDGCAVWPGIKVDYTGKTQFIFKINKGIFSAHDNKMVNAKIAAEKKRIPYTNMIYFGDGETDIPVKIVGMFGGSDCGLRPSSAKRRHTPKNFAVREG